MEKEYSRATKYRNRKRVITSVASNGNVFIDTLYLTQARGDFTRLRERLKNCEVLASTREMIRYRMRPGLVVIVNYKPRVGEPAIQVQFTRSAASELLSSNLQGVGEAILDLDIDSPTITRLDLSYVFPAEWRLDLDKFSSSGFKTKMPIIDTASGEVTGVYFGGRRSQDGIMSPRNPSKKYLRIYNKKEYATIAKQDDWVQFIDKQGWSDRNVYTIEVQYGWPYLRPFVGRDWYKYIIDSSEELKESIMKIFTHEMSKILYANDYISRSLESKPIPMEDERSNEEEKKKYTLKKAINCCYKRSGYDSNRVLHQIKSIFEELGISGQSNDIGDHQMKPIDN